MEDDRYDDRYDRREYPRERPRSMLEGLDVKLIIGIAAIALAGVAIIISLAKSPGCPDCILNANSSDCICGDTNYIANITNNITFCPMVNNTMNYTLNAPSCPNCVMVGCGNDSIRTVCRTFDLRLNATYIDNNITFAGNLTYNGNGMYSLNDTNRTIEIRII